MEIPLPLPSLLFPSLSSLPLLPASSHKSLESLPSVFVSKVWLENVRFELNKNASIW